MLAQHALPAVDVPAKPADESAECAGQRREVARTALVEHCVAAAVVEGILNFFLNKVDSLIPFDFFVLVDALPFRRQV